MLYLIIGKNVVYSLYLVLFGLFGVVIHSRPCTISMNGRGFCLLVCLLEVLDATGK